MYAVARPFEVLFLTNFSNLCFRAIPALAQMSDDLDMRLTIAHATDQVSDVRRLEENLRSFFPEADHFPRCRRVLERGTALETLQRLSSATRVDLIVAPAGDPLGMPRFGHRSLRSRLVCESAVPVWTHGPGAIGRRQRPTRHVACVVDERRKGRAHLRLAATYAARLDASLHVIQPLDNLFDEGRLLMLGYTDPFDRVQTMRDVRQEIGDQIVLPEVYPSPLGRIPDLLGQLDADVVFLDGPWWTSYRWLRLRMSALLDKLPCPAICVKAEQNDLQWKFHQPARWEDRTSIDTEAPAGIAAVLAGEPETSWPLVEPSAGDGARYVEER